MFQKNKYSKSGQVTSNYKQSQNAFLQSLKYHPNLYSKKKTTISKKLSFQSNNNKFSQNQTWKKHNSYNWNKENDKNYLNYDHHISNKDYNDYYYVPKEKRENKANYNKEYSYLYSSESNEYNSNKNKKFEKNEKKISIDATTQSNSSSHEESNNNNQYNFNDKNSAVTNENFNSNDFKPFFLEEGNNNQNMILALNLNNLNSIPNLQDFENNNIIDSNIINSINNDFEINDETNINYIPRPPIQTQKKNKKQTKIKKSSVSSKELNFQKSNSTNIESEFQLNEPYNKFNSVNNELITHVINPIVENTEILEVNVKIAKDKSVVFKLRRFDDLFLTVKLFCEINSISEKLMKPIITKALCTLNSIYQIYNTQLDSKNINILKIIKTINNDTSI